MEILKDTSLIVAVYNRPLYVRMVLESVLRQTCLPAHIIIADDGSSDKELDTVITDFTQRLPIPLIRLWQEDNGWGKCRIVNKAVGLAKDYIVFIDADMILHPDFIKEHYKYRHLHTVLRGTTAMLTPEMTGALLDTTITGFAGKSFKKRNTIHLPFPLFVRFKEFSGRNFSLHKGDFVAVNGLDNSFKEIGGEDTDLSFRLTNNGVSIKQVFGKCLAKHLYHELHPYMHHRKQHILSEQRQVIMERQRKGVTRVENGYRELLQTNNA